MMTKPSRKLISRATQVAVVIVAIGAVIVLNPLSYISGPEPTEVLSLRDRSEISVADLNRTINAEGQLEFVGAIEIVHVGSGTLTWTAPTGSVASSGDILYRVDNVPVVLLNGSTPAYRTMSVDDVGADVQQLESELAALGYDPSGTMTVDHTFTSYTATVVERWQADIGVAETGQVELGAVHFSPTDLTVGAHTANVGDQVNNSQILSLSSLQREITFELEVSDLDTIDVGTLVSARLPDRSSVDASVLSIVPGSNTWAVTAQLLPAEGLTSAAVVPVTVQWTVSLSSGVLSVPAVALTRLDNGTYSVEVVNEDETTNFVAVDVGAKSGTIVEITTDLPAGTVVIAP